MIVNSKRVIKNLQEMAHIKPNNGKGITRFSYTQEDFTVKQLLIKEMIEIGMKIEVDDIGNIRGRLFGEDRNSSVVSGSHVDTVRNGGMYDGMLGVIGSLEVARLLVENNVKLKKNYDFIIFAEEEGSNFKAGLLGSQNIVLGIPLEDRLNLKTEDGYTFNDMISKSIENIPYPHDTKFYKDDKIDSMIELHIEQGNYLENLGKTIGIVKGIYHLRWLGIKITGTANHAGATPMGYRKDPMVEASKIISTLPNIVSNTGDKTTVATVGKLEIHPGSANVIPQSVDFIVDLRGIEPKTLDTVQEELKKLLNIVEGNGFQVEMKELVRAEEKFSNEELLELMRGIATEKNYSHVEMYSGANHDTSVMSEIARVAMIFVPSVDGRSHCPEEYTKNDDVTTGIQFLYDTLHHLLVN